MKFNIKCEFENSHIEFPQISSNDVTANIRQNHVPIYH